MKLPGHSASSSVGRVSRRVAVLMLLAVLAAGVVSAQSVGTFTDAGHMAASRANHTATLLADGRVLIAGGFVFVPGERRSRFRSSAEIYDPSTGTFTPTDEMTEPRAYHTATLLLDGRVLITGGQGINQFDRSVVGSAELYDPTTGKFTATGPMVAARLYHAAVLLGTGKVLIISGAEWQSRDTTIDLKAELYDPASGTFAATGAPVSVKPPQGEEFIQPTATVLHDGRVLVTWTSTLAELYDPRAGTFRAVGRTIVGRSYDGGTHTLLADGTVLLAGGAENGAIDGAEVYDPITESFTLTGRMVFRKFRHTATLLRDGTVLTTGANQEGWDALIISEQYDPATGRFSVRENLINPRYSHTATLLRDARVLIVGGISGELSTTTSAEIYTTALMVPVPVFPLDGIVTETRRPRLQIHNLPSPGAGRAWTYRFEWSERDDFQAGSLTGFIEHVPEGRGDDTAHEMTEDLVGNTVYYWRARAVRTQRVGVNDVILASEYSHVRSFKTPALGPP